MLCLATLMPATAQTELRTEAQLTTASGDHAPLWLNANRYGLSSLDKSNGYVRAALVRPLSSDSTRQWRRGFAADLAVADGFTSTIVVQQMYAELGWKQWLLTAGAKEQPMQMKNQELSSGSQTLGINARPVPGVRLEIPDYWDIPGTKGWMAFKGHIFYGWATDANWQKNFIIGERRRTEDTKYHTKAGYLRIGPADRHVNAELGLEMGCQFGGKTFNYYNPTPMIISNESGLKGALHALIPGGSDPDETDYMNTEGNHVGSMLLKVNADYPAWAAAIYADHYFEDHSQLFFFSRNGYGTGDEWDKKVRNEYFVYDLRDAMLGVELTLKNIPWLSNIVAEYLYTKYQSGPVYHDHTKTMPDQVASVDNYYNHHIFTGWQHWGQVMGNPLYRSPLYNKDHDISVEDNRFWAWHFGVSGTPVGNLHYRLLLTYQKGFGTYQTPFCNPKYNTSMLAEVKYDCPDDSNMKGWSLRGAFALDRGQLLGDNTGVQLTVGKRLNIEHKR